MLPINCSLFGQAVSEMILEFDQPETRIASDGHAC
jgi:hypothetical protein